MNTFKRIFLKYCSSLFLYKFCIGLSFFFYKTTYLSIGLFILFYFYHNKNYLHSCLHHWLGYAFNIEATDKGFPSQSSLRGAVCPDMYLNGDSPPHSPCICCCVWDRSSPFISMKLSYPSCAGHQHLNNRCSRKLLERSKGMKETAGGGFRIQLA